MSHENLIFFEAPNSLLYTECHVLSFLVVSSQYSHTSSDKFVLLKCWPFLELIWQLLQRLLLKARSVIGSSVFANESQQLALVVPVISLILHMMNWMKYTLGIFFVCPEVFQPSFHHFFQVKTGSGNF